MTKTFDTILFLMLQFTIFRVHGPFFSKAIGSKSCIPIPFLYSPKVLKNYLHFHWKIMENHGKSWKINMLNGNSTIPMVWYSPPHIFHNLHNQLFQPGTYWDTSKTPMENRLPVPSGTNSLLLKMAIGIVEFPFNMLIFHDFPLCKRKNQRVDMAVCQNLVPLASK